MRLNEIEAEYGDEVHIDWRSFLLRPEPEPRPMAKFTEYTKSWERPAGIEPRAAFNPWSGVHEPPSHSLPSAAAGKVAAVQGPAAYRSFSDRLFEAYFTENRTISDRDVLLDVAGEAGLDRDAFASYWQSNEASVNQSVMSDYVTAVESEITGVPAVVVSRTWLIPGAVDTDQYRAAIAEARKKLESDGQPPAVDPESEVGGAGE